MCDEKRLGLLIHCGNNGACGSTFRAWSNVIGCGGQPFSSLTRGPTKNAAPARKKDGHCVETIGRHLSCEGKGAGMIRACVCVKKGVVAFGH